MTKLITLPTLYGFYQSPVVALFILIALVFLADLYSQYIESKKISCAPFPDLTIWSYADVNTMARLHKLKPANRTRIVLTKELQALLYMN